MPGQPTPDVLDALERQARILIRRPSREQIAELTVCGLVYVRADGERRLLEDILHPPEWRWESQQGDLDRWRPNLWWLVPSRPRSVALWRRASRPGLRLNNSRFLSWLHWCRSGGGVTKRELPFPAGWSA